LEYAKAVTNGQAGRDHQKAAREFPAAGPAHGVDGLPGDDHGHHCGLAGAGGQFQGEAHELRVRVVVRVGKMLQEGLTGLPFWGDLGQPDGGLNGFNLTKERPDAGEIVMPPMLEKACGFGGDLPVVWVRPAPPLVYMMAKFVDGRGLIVLLSFSGEPLSFVENNLLLIRLSLALPRLGNRRNELRSAPGFDNTLCRLALIVELPMAFRLVIG
jgi:hypothetical protein